MICNLCKNEIDNVFGCCACRKRFHVGDVVYCLEDCKRFFHYCSLRCADITSRVRK